MHKTEYNILFIFKDDPETEICTSDILKIIYPKKQKSIEARLGSSMYDKEKILAAKRDKAKLHRRLLYHLNRLVEEGTLKVSKEGAKGEKYFSLAIDKGEELILKKGKRKVIISKPIVPAMPIEGQEQKGLVAKFETATWIDRVNSVLLECKNIKDLEMLTKAVDDCFSCVNDVIGLNNFEFCIKQINKKDLDSFMEKVIVGCKDYGKKISCIIDVENIKEKEDILNSIIRYAKIESGEIDFIFTINVKGLQENIEFFKGIIDTYANMRMPLYIKNKDLNRAPHLIGKAGVYTFDEKEWRQYENKLQSKSKGIICGQSTIAIDVKRCLEKDNTVKAFKIFVRKMVTSLLSANSLQRRRAEEYFKPILWLMDEPREFFLFGRNYIRFWNYGWKEPKMNQEFVIELMNSTRELMDRFCIVEENIYKSCGMPTRFRTAFSSAFRKFKDDPFFTRMSFPKVEIKDTKNLYSKELKNILAGKEQIFDVFSGGDRVRFFRTGEIDPEDICREFNIIMTSYRLPLFCYDFGEVKGTNLKLTNFI